MSASARQEDFLFAEHVLRRGFATEEQVQECLGLLERLRGEMELDETLVNIMLKKGYIAKAQVSVIQADISPERADRAKNQIEGYQLLVRLGSGAMGSVYKAHHMKLDIPVALKVLRVDLAKSKTQVERLKREAQLAARLNHVNVVRSLDVGESNGFHYFAMEFVDGQTVRQRLHRGRIREKEALRIVRDVARGLQHAHEHGVVHRDVKPANIILTKEGTVKLADFGLARGQEPSELTLEHASIGTPQYLAPEQARRGADATPRSDIFSLGASLYHMVTGRPPFSGDNLGEIFQKVLASEFDPPEKVVPDLSLDTIYVIHRCMRGNPRGRYSSAGELLADLERVEQGRRVAPSDFKGDYAKYLKGRRIRHALIGTAAILVIVAASLFTARVISAHRAEQVRSARCRTANNFGRGKPERANTLEDLEQLREQLRAARPADCDDDEVRDLLKRLGLVEADIPTLGAVEQLLVDSESDEADFVALHAQAEKLVRKAKLGGAVVRARDIQKTIEERSKKAAKYRQEQIYSAGRQESRDKALEELKAFARDLEKRYLPISTEDLGVDAAADARAFELLIRAWDQAEKDYGQLFEANKKNHRYKLAHESLERLLDDRRKARERAIRAGLPEKNFLDWFPEDRRRRALEQAEWEHFRRLSLKADGFIKKNDPKGVEQAVRDFQEHAKETSGEVARLLEKIRKAQQQLVVDQTREIKRLEEVVERALVDREYGRAWTLANEAFLRPDWIPDLRTRVRQLFSRAQMVKALLDRYTANASKQGIRPAGGADPDRFLEADGTPFSLKDKEREHLEKMLAFGEKDTRLRGYFEVVESLHAEDPRKSLSYVKSGIVLLRRATDPYFRELMDREIALEKLVKLREHEAAQLDDLMQAAVAAKQEIKAGQYIKTLLSDQRDGYANTDYVRTHRERLIDIKKRLDRVSRVERIRLEAALPDPKNQKGLSPAKRSFGFDAESGIARFRFTFKEWWPDEGRIPRNRMGELNRAAREFWSDFFSGQDKIYPREDWGRLFERAKHELLWFNDFLVPDKKHGGARFDPGPEKQSNNQIWNTRRSRRTESLREVTLTNPFRADADWSIELTISWDVDLKGNKVEPKVRPDGKPDKGELMPGYFVLAAGELQAGVIAAIKPFGGGNGGRMFRAASVEEGFEQRMDAFQFANWIKGHPQKKEDRAYFKQYVAGATYRVRLEKRKGKLRFFAATLEDWEKQGFDEKRDFFLQMNAPGKSYLEGAMSVNRNRVFRIFSLNPFRLHEVVIEGQLLK